MLRDQLTSIYAAVAEGPAPLRLPHLLPFVGDAFAEPADGVLRVVAVGLNSYIGENDAPPEALPAMPGWFRGWVVEGKLPFFRGVRRECAALAGGCTAAPGSRFARCEYRDPQSLYVTNAVKRYLPWKSGRYAAALEQTSFDEGGPIWRDELRTMAAHGALPHLVVVFGARAWWPTCSVLLELCEDPREPAFVRYEPRETTSPLFHRLNVITVAAGATHRPCVVVRLDHPASRPRWTAARMLADAEFRAVIGAAGGDGG